MAAMLWVFYVSKILDFFDTIIMVARGSWTQFSFLHVYHHTSIFMIYWLNVNAGYDGVRFSSLSSNQFSLATTHNAGCDGVRFSAFGTNRA
jgi:elongation of very long chain fatty acids protein 4